jgi:hypothetical protein
MGECKLPLKKLYKESESYGCYVVEKDYTLESGKQPNVRSVKKVQGSLKFRFIAY